MTAAPRVVIAMSGGVDSSVAAAMLVKQGYDVIGVTMRLRPECVEPRAGGCCSLSAVGDAKRVTDALGIEHYVVDLRRDFQKLVIDDFVAEYRVGHTPNPCVRCNQYIKFDVLLRHAIAMGADAIATGHYARVEFDEASGRWLLKRGADRSKDQSYALYTMTQEQLSKTMFPVGNQSKVETRAIASELGLPVADKPDSQEICFVPDNKYGGFLAEEAPETVKPGPILDTQGNTLGSHKGIAFYTIGQRKGLGIATGRPVYVTEIDRAQNAIILGANEELYRDVLIAYNVNLIAADELTGCVVVSGKIRYNMHDSPAEVCPLDPGAIRVQFNKPQRAVTPGQSVVLYEGDNVFGGGVIADSEEAARIVALSEGLTKAPA
jgi:tRNA-uridine 2-sulfurtransferase